MKKINLLLTLSLLTNLLLFVYIASLSKSRPSHVDNNRPQTTETKPLDRLKMTQIVNEWRVSEGLEPYTEISALCDIASKRVRETKEDFSHDKFVADYKDYPSVVSENISEHTDKEDETLRGYLSSKPHREALLDAYKYSCIATDEDRSVQIFSNCENGCPEL